MYTAWKISDNYICSDYEVVKFQILCEKRYRFANPITFDAVP